jgi:cyanophycinase-like exopeptidase
LTESPRSLPGPLILAGGAEFDERMATADRVWLRLLGLGIPRLGLLPTANEARPEAAARNGVRHFRGLVTNAEPLMVTDKAGASSPKIVDKIEDLDAIYMAGGSPTYLAEALRASPAWEAMVRRWREGMAFGGSSAGAMAPCEAIYVQERWADGLGLVRGLVVLPHFNRRDEPAVEKARTAVTSRGLVGVGIDESTAAIWHKGSWQAEGLGRVVVLAPAAITSYRAAETIEELPQPG